MHQEISPSNISRTKLKLIQDKDKDRDKNKERKPVNYMEIFKQKRKEKAKKNISPFKTISDEISITTYLERKKSYPYRQPYNFFEKIMKTESIPQVDFT